MKVKPEQAKITDLRVSAYRVPTDAPESDGTLRWESTTLVLVELTAGGATGLGYTYAGESAAVLIQEKLADIVRGSNALEIRKIWDEMARAIRNLGRPGVASNSISAVDAALWDLKSRLLGLPLAQLLGAVRDSVPLYGSGGFTSYSKEQLQRQLGGWVRQGFQCVKMKVGRDPQEDIDRVRRVREAIGSGVELFVDANGAYSAKQALAHARIFGDLGVTWFEEPVSSDDLEGLRFIRERAPDAMDITAGEYGYDRFYFRRMLEAGAVDVLQPDATRCGGVTGFMLTADLADAFSTPISAHTAPSLHVHLCCCAPGARHIEYFHDHVRIEQMLFEGVTSPAQGHLSPDLSRPGLGIQFKQADAKQFKIG